MKYICLRYFDELKWETMFESGWKIEKFPGPMELTRQQPERRFLEKRLAELG